LHGRSVQHKSIATGMSDDVQLIRSRAAVDGNGFVNALDGDQVVAVVAIHFELV